MCWKLCCRESVCGDCVCEGGYDVYGKSAVVGLEFGLFIECIECSDWLLMLIESRGGCREFEGGEVM